MKACFLGVLLISAMPLAAEPLSESDARKQLFSSKGYTVQVSRKLSRTDAATVRALVPLISQQMNQPVRYYASIAYSPKDGLVHEALQGALNFHSFEASDAAAIAACNKQKSRGTPSCEVAARVVPKGFKNRGLTLSAEATSVFEKRFRRDKGARVFSISPASGAWGIGETDADAQAACGAKDCEIVIRK